MRIVHIGSAGAIMIPFVEFVNQNFSSSDHLFLLDLQHGHPVPETNNVVQLGWRSKFGDYRVRFSAMYRADKVILHGLFDARMTVLLALQPWLLKKIYWVIWGGDLYVHQSSQKTNKWKVAEFFRKVIIAQIGHFITHIKGDYELAERWYGAKGQWHECFLYPSNLYRNYPVKPVYHEGINILLGNSASITNNHMDAIERLRPFANENIHIYCPLSYGDIDYGDQVVRAGVGVFGKKFIPLREFMAFDKYLKLLSEIDVAIFNHDRQQGMGNITTLLGMGKKVFMRSGTTSYMALCEVGLIVYDIDLFNLQVIEEFVVNNNIKKTSNYFSAGNLIKQWRAIFSGSDTEK